MEMYVADSDLEITRWRYSKPFEMYVTVSIQITRYLYWHNQYKYLLENQAKWGLLQKML